MTAPLKRENHWKKISGSGEKTELVTAVSEDQTHGHIQAQCRVRIAFATVDETVPKFSKGGSGGGGSSKGSGGGGGGSTGITSGGVTKQRARHCRLCGDRYLGAERGRAVDVCGPGADLRKGVGGSPQSLCQCRERTERLRLVPV